MKFHQFLRKRAESGPDYTQPLAVQTAAVSAQRVVAEDFAAQPQGGRLVGAVWVWIGDTMATGRFVKFGEGGNIMRQSHYTLVPQDSIRNVSGIGPAFVEGVDGKLYGFFASVNKLRRWDPSTDPATMEDLIQSSQWFMGQDGYSPLYGVPPFPGAFTGQGAWEGRTLIPGGIFAAPDGSIFFVRNSVGSQSQVDPQENRGATYSGVLVHTDGTWQATGGGGDILGAVSDWGKIIATDLGYVGTNNGGFVPRRIIPVILRDNTWMGAEPLRPLRRFLQVASIGGGNTFTEQHMDAPFELGFPTQAGPNHGYNQDPDLMSFTSRMWGNAWWHKVIHAQPWDNTTNFQVRSSTPGHKFRYQLKSLLHQNGALWIGENGNPPSVFYTTRRDQMDAAGEVLPTLYPDLEINSRAYSEAEVTGLTFPPVPADVNSGVPYQEVHAMCVDRTHLYILMMGVRDGFGFDVPGGVYRAPIPELAEVPGPWVRIIAEPDNVTWRRQLDVSGIWPSMAVSKTGVWLIEWNAHEGWYEIVKYGKTGAGRRVVYHGTAGQQVPFSLSTVFEARWQ